MLSPISWCPTRIERVEEVYDTSMGTAKVKTDAGRAYLKAMGNRQGPHALASELVATQLAQWFGLQVADFAVLEIPKEACFELPRGAYVQPGPAFLSRQIEGATWGGSEAELRSMENSDDITRLVIFDTWVRNCDRHPPDLRTRKPNYANVYLANTNQAGRSRLIAIDHTHCFNCGRDLSPSLANISNTKDERTYGLFPPFKEYITPFGLAWCRSLLASIKADDVRRLVASIPEPWDVDDLAKNALTELICTRAAFLADRLENWQPEIQREEFS